MSVIHEILNNGIGAQLEFEFPLRIGIGVFHPNVLNGQNVLVGGRVINDQPQIQIIDERNPDVDQVIAIARILQQLSRTAGEDLPDPIRAAENLTETLEAAEHFVEDQQTEGNGNSSMTALCSAVAWGAAAIVGAVALKVFTNI